jgi:hypothetical protein
MRMPRIRFTIRRMMVATAIVAVVIALKVRRDRFIALAAHHAWKEDLYLVLQPQKESMCPGIIGGSDYSIRESADSSFINPLVRREPP